MSGKNKNKKAIELFSEDITKNLVKKILDNDFNIDYNNKLNQNNHKYDEDYHKPCNIINYKPANKTIHKNKSSKILKEKNNYRKNIEIYGKDFFDNDEIDDYEESTSLILWKVLNITIILVLTISTTLLALNLKITKNDLINNEIKMQELVSKNELIENKIKEESLKSEIANLQYENKKLKSKLETNYKDFNNSKENHIASSNQSKPITQSNLNKIIQNDSNISNISEYTVKKGDIIWNISKEVYGSGSHFQKILDANGLKENSILQEGQKLIIPKIN